MDLVKLGLELRLKATLILHLQFYINNTFMETYNKAIILLQAIDGLQADTVQDYNILKTFFIELFDFLRAAATFSSAVSSFGCSGIGTYSKTHYNLLQSFFPLSFYCKLCFLTFPLSQTSCECIAVAHQ